MQNTEKKNCRRQKAVVRETANSNTIRTEYPQKTTGCRKKPKNDFNITRDREMFFFWENTSNKCPKHQTISLNHCAKWLY